ncbi:MAG: DUF3800 domain-containing protein [Sulfurospirillaceae bacterium]|nr:DUF3800 domain-containing protein [Sulfurospirillaceae bacterium]
MKLNVYCDETLPDLFTTKNSVDKKLLIGSLWLEDALLNDVKNKIKTLRNKYNCWGEIKWAKVSKSKELFYLELIDLFFSYGMQMRFRCIAIDPKQINWSFHGNDKELGFYKFYYFLLKHWIADFNEYSIYCDAKVNRNLSRLKTLHQVLENTNWNANINRVQALPSNEVVLIQMSDFLLGIASSKINNIAHTNSSKTKIIEYVENHLGHRICPTSGSENKFNVFNIQLGGW